MRKHPLLSFKAWYIKHRYEIKDGMEAWGQMMTAILTVLAIIMVLQSLGCPYFARR